MTTGIIAHKPHAARDFSPVASSTTVLNRNSEIPGLELAQTAMPKSKQAASVVSGEVFNPVFDFIKNKFPFYGYAFTSVMHAISALTSIKNILPENLKKTFDKITVRCSKAIPSITYSILAIEAFQKNKSFDFIARMLEPLFVPWMNLEDIHLARGMSAGMTLIDFSQMHKIKNSSQSFLENLSSNLKVSFENIKEIFSAGFGNGRKIFAAHEQKDDGHTMSFCGYLIMLGSLLGTCFGANKRNLMNKVGGVMRNLGGFLGDMTMIVHGDRAFKLSGMFYAANAVIDALQRFLPKSIIDPINHINMILNNVGTYYYGEISRRRNKNTFNNSFAEA